MRFTCFARKSGSEFLVKDEVTNKMASITIPIAVGMPHLITRRRMKKPVKPDFTRIYISFYNSFTMSGNSVAYVCLPVPNKCWQFLLRYRQYVRAGIGEVKTIFNYKRL